MCVHITHARKYKICTIAKPKKSEWREGIGRD